MYKNKPPKRGLWNAGEDFLSSVIVCVYAHNALGGKAVTSSETWKSINPFYLEHLSNAVTARVVL